MNCWWAARRWMGSDKTVKVWDATSGRQILTLEGHSGGISSVDISANGQRIVSGSRDRTGRVWNPASGTELFTLKTLGSWVNAVAFSPDDRRIVTGSED